MIIFWSHSKKPRPSGHVISPNIGKDNGGSIPSNLLTIANTESSSLYFRFCKKFGIKPHPARFPEGVPSFFIKMLTDEGDLVLDLFAGSNTTGFAAEKLNRQWLSFEKEQEYLAASSFRFLNGQVDEEVESVLAKIRNGQYCDLSPYCLSLPKSN